MAGAKVAGMISLVLAALSIVVALLNHSLHFLAIRDRWLLILFVIFLILGVFLIMSRGSSRAGNAPPAAK